MAKKKRYQKPQIKQVDLKPEEAVLGGHRGRLAAVARPHTCVLPGGAEVDTALQGGEGRIGPARRC